MHRATCTAHHAPRDLHCTTCAALARLNPACSAPQGLGPRTTPPPRRPHRRAACRCCSRGLSGAGGRRGCRSESRHGSTRSAVTACAAGRLTASGRHGPGRRLVAGVRSRPASHGSRACAKARALGGQMGRQRGQAAGAAGCGPRRRRSPWRPRGHGRGAVGPGSDAHWRGRAREGAGSPGAPRSGGRRCREAAGSTGRGAAGAPRCWRAAGLPLGAEARLNPVCSDGRRITHRGSKHARPGLQWPRGRGLAPGPRSAVSRGGQHAGRRGRRALAPAARGEEAGRGSGMRGAAKGGVVGARGCAARSPPLRPPVRPALGLRSRGCVVLGVWGWGLFDSF